MCRVILTDNLRLFSFQEDLCSLSLGLGNWECRMPRKKDSDLSTLYFLEFSPAFEDPVCLLCVLWNALHFRSLSSLQWIAQVSFMRGFTKGRAHMIISDGFF